MNLYIYVNQTSILDIKIITGIPNIPNDFMAGTHKIKIKHEPRKLTNVTKPGLFIDKKKDSNEVIDETKIAEDINTIVGAIASLKSCPKIKGIKNIDSVDNNRNKHETIAIITLDDFAVSSAADSKSFPEISPNKYVLIDLGRELSPLKAVNATEYIPKDLNPKIPTKKIFGKLFMNMGNIEDGYLFSEYQYNCLILWNLILDMLENKISLKKNIPIEEDITFDIKRDRVAEKLFKLSSKENIITNKKYDITLVKIIIEYSFAMPFPKNMVWRNVKITVINIKQIIVTK